MTSPAETPCAFYEIIAGRAESSLAYEDEHVVAFMDIRPLTQGHVLVVPAFMRTAWRLSMREQGARAVLGRAAGVLRKTMPGGRVRFQEPRTGAQDRSPGPV